MKNIFAHNTGKKISMASPFIIGITGGSASGKSSFSRDLGALFPADLMILCEDNYYLPKDLVPVDANGIQNFDTPAAFDHAELVKHISSLRSGIPVEKREYTYYNPGVEPKMLTISPAPLIVLEGIFSFHSDSIKDLLDLKLYIDADPVICYNRRIQRDLKERGLDEQDVNYRWTNHIMPAYEANREAYRSSADIIIANNSGYGTGLDIIKSYLETVLARRSG